MKANKTITSADIYMSIIFVILFLGVMAIGQLFSSIESLNKITQLNFNQIITWGKIAQRIKFFIGTRENRIESPTLILKIQKDLAELIQKNDGFYRELEHTLEQSKVFFHFRQLDNDNLALITVDPELISRAKEVRDAPLSVFQTNFDYWPISTSNAILSDRYIAKLYQHEEKLSLQLEKQFHTLYLDGIVIISIATLGIILVWLGFLRPTVRKLADAKADIAFILDNAPGYICSYDPQGKFMSANQSYLNFVGVKRVQELLGKHISEFIGIDNWKQIKNHVKRAVNGEPLEFDVEMTMEGKKVVLMVSYRPKLDANGTVTAIVAMIIEITDRYEVERALRLSEENLRTTLNSIGDAVVTTDKYEKIIRMNPQAVRLSGYSEEKATGRSLNQIFKIFNPKTQENTPNLIEIQKKEPELKTSDISHRSGNLLLSSNKQEYQIAESCSTIKNSKGEVIGYVLVFRDVTEEYLLNQKLAHSEKLQSIGQLAGGIAHDFNNILAGIQGSVDLLAHPSFKIPTHEKEKHIKYINRLINRGAGLTEQLTIFARIKELAFKSVNTRDLIQDSLAIVQSTSDRRISFEFIDNTYNPMVFGNDSTLQTAILNIILNAVDAIENTGTIRIVLNNTNYMQLKGTILG
ncbi:MAG TPA: PAS domain S-box protein, partial [Oceanospirillales bacterium]|nr:PAS domain S-box protein [Oceanospirillales bacterium]